MIVRRNKFEIGDFMERVIDVRNGRNLTMLADFYELTMGNGYMKEGV